MKTWKFSDIKKRNKNEKICSLSKDNQRSISRGPVYFIGCDKSDAINRTNYPTSISVLKGDAVEKMEQTNSPKL